VANYDAVIRLIVQGEQALKGVQSQINDLYKTIGKIEKAGILNAKATEATLQLAKQHVTELERAAQATLKQVAQNEKRIVQQSRLNAAVDLYERRLTQATNSGAAGLKKFEGQIAQIEQAFKFFKDRGNVTAVQALATELGRMVEYSNTVSRNERARAASLSQLRGFAKQIADYEQQGLNVADAKKKFDQLAEVAGSNQLNDVKKYTEALVRKLQLLKEESKVQAQINRETSAAAAETARQAQKLADRQREFTARTDESAGAARRLTAEYLRMQRAAIGVAKINEVQGPAQLLLPPAAPGSPAMSGGARPLITGAVERLGSPSLTGRGMRTADEAAMALRYVENLPTSRLPVSQPPLPPRRPGMFGELLGAGISGGGRGGGGGDGRLSFNPNPTQENLALGAGFPLLFGGGPAQVAGGLAGSMFGSGFGGQILGAALAQQLSDALARVKEIGAAANELNMDKLRDSTAYVNAELETSIRLLIEAGKTEEARTMAIERAAEALALAPDTMKDINNATNAVTSGWDEFSGAITGTLALVAVPFAAAIGFILKVLTLAATTLNQIGMFVGNIIKGIGQWVINLLGAQKLAKFIAELFGRTNEEQEKEVALLTATNEKLLREVQTRKKILDLEAQRTLGRTDAEKLINAELTKQQAQIQIKAEYQEKELELRNKLAGITSVQGKLEVEQAIRLNSVKETQALKEQAIKDLLVAQGLEIEANAKKYSLAAEAVQRQIDALERGSQVKQSQFAVEAALNDLYGAQLQRQYEIAGTAAERYNIALLQFRQQVKAADIEYRLALANNEILVKKAVLQTRLVELKYKELEAEKEIAIAQAGARGNTPDQIAAIAGSYDKALGVQNEVLQSAYDQLQATKEITKNQNEVAKAVFQTKLIQAESTLAQKLTSDEIGMSKRAADNLAASLRVSAQETALVEQKGRAVVGVIEVGTQRTVIFAQAMSNVAAAANDAAYNIDRAFRNQLKLNQARAAQPAPAPVKKAAQGAFWAGGFTAFAKGGMVTGPTLGLVGEGGESEYIIPESKMATAASNYLAGGRGAGIMEGGGGGGSAPAINITTGPVVEFNGERYVTMRDMERGLQQMATNIYSGLRTPSGRYATGVR